jgi:hypothetical protein
MEKPALSKIVASKPSKNNYCNKHDMLLELRNFKRTGVISEKLGKMLLDIAYKFVEKNSKFRNYPDKLDFIGDSILRMVSQLHKFNTEHPKANPFGYFTQVVYHHMICCIRGLHRRLDFETCLKESFKSGLTAYYSEPTYVIHDDESVIEIPE